MPMKGGKVSMSGYPAGSKNKRTAKGTKNQAPKGKKAKSGKTSTSMKRMSY